MMKMMKTVRITGAMSTQRRRTVMKMKIPEVGNSSPGWGGIRTLLLLYCSPLLCKFLQDKKTLGNYTWLVEENNFHPKK